MRQAENIFDSSSVSVAHFRAQITQDQQEHMASSCVRLVNELLPYLWRLGRKLHQFVWREYGRNDGTLAEVAKFIGIEEE